MSSTPTRFPGGLTTVRTPNPLGQYGLPDPTGWHTYFNDFDTYVAANWTVTTTQAGSGSSTEALTNGDGGLLLITNDNADDDNVFMQKVGESFLLQTGRKCFFKTRFKTSDATQSDLVIGLQVTDTTPLSVTDGVYFLKADGAATFDIVCRKDATTGSTSASAIASLADDTFVSLAWYYDGKGNLAYYVNDDQLGTLAVTDYLPDTTLTLSFGIQNGEAVAKTMTLDYLFASEEGRS